MATLDIPKVAETRRRANDFCHGDHEDWRRSKHHGHDKAEREGGADRRRVQMPLWLLGRLLFGFQGLQIANNHPAAINLDHSLGL